MDCYGSAIGSSEMKLLLPIRSIAGADLIGQVTHCEKGNGRKS
jgi:hypothetical protein